MCVLLYMFIYGDKKDMRIGIETRTRKKEEQYGT